VTPERPLVSVITPAFNAAATLERAHESVRRQRVPWQHVIVDDGSTDGTPRVIASLLADGRVTAATQSNRGPGAALNHGIRLAQGAYTAFLDADDEFCPEHLCAHVEFMEANPSVDLLWGGQIVIAARREDEFVPDVVRGHGTIHLSECIVQGTLFARSRVFDKLLFTEDRAIWYQDYEFVQRARAAFVVERFTQPTYRYYRGGGASLVDSVKRTWRGVDDGG
jgi:glycosyltransferase involved in cell wall biosynthesis